MRWYRGRPAFRPQTGRKVFYFNEEKNGYKKGSSDPNIWPPWRWRNMRFLNARNTLRTIEYKEEE